MSEKSEKKHAWISEQFDTLIPEYVEHLRRSGYAEGSITELPGPAKHFLVWIAEVGLDLSDVDINVVRRFLDHECTCPRPKGQRYRNNAVRSRNFSAWILRFVEFLESSGRIGNPMAFDAALERVEAFASYLTEQGYASGTVDRYRHSCRHFAVWLHQHRTPLSAIDSAVVARFATHDCLCPGMFVQNASRDDTYLGQIGRFAKYLAAIGVIAGASMSGGQKRDNRFDVFADWLRRHRGIGEITILAHIRTIEELLPVLGGEPHLYDAALIRRAVLGQHANGSGMSAQRVTRSLRMYLRFLASTGACSPALVGAIPTVPRWRLSTLPRYILSDDVERVIASCDLTTSRGIRDRAIVLLLARLALRAGDVAYLRLPDIDWDNALIRVSGKSKRTVALPLPQDVGDAILHYVEHARPAVAEDRVFMRSIAPFQPFSHSSAVTIVVREAIERAGVKNANLRGAYLLRHSAATDMLRSGATLEAVGAVLRHQSPDTTAIYAKVDVPMLEQVAQPWIGSVTCR